jgi:hypothetical protein
MSLDLISGGKNETIVDLVGHYGRYRIAVGSVRHL